MSEPLEKPRSALVTAVSWLVIVLAALALPISACSSLMIAAGSQGTAHIDPLGFLSVVCGPPFALVCGIGMLRRKAWARYGVLALLAAMLLSNGYDLVTAPSESITTIGPDGVLNTRLAGGNFYAVPLMLVCAGLIAVLCLRQVRAEFAAGPR
jgi:hypothetical protein